MATQSVQKTKEGPIWVLGTIAVPTPGTPVNIMSLVDPTNINDPASPTPGTVGADEYTRRCQQITLQAYKATTHGLVVNAGNIYVCVKGVQGAGNRDDYGSIIAVLTPGQTFSLGSSAQVKNVFSPYAFFLDADVAADAAQVSLYIF
jgi:hypothetical protein